MTPDPGQQRPTNEPGSPGRLPVSEVPGEALAPGGRKCSLLGNLLESATGLTRADVAVFIQELGPFFDASVPDAVVANLCEAAKPFFAAGAPVATTLKLFADLFEQAPPVDQLSLEVFTELLKADSALRHASQTPTPAANGSADHLTDRRTLLPYLTALTLMRPGLSGKQAANSLRALGEILLMAPSDSATTMQNHRLLRDLDPLLSENAQAEDLTCLAALLRNVDPRVPGNFSACFRSFCAFVPQLRAAAPEAWGELRVATRAAVKAGFANAWEILPAYAELRAARRSPIVQRAFLLSMAELPKDETAGVDPARLAAIIGRLWASLPPPDSACRDLLTGLSQIGPAALRERLARVSARGFERSEPELAHFEALASLVDPQFSGPPTAPNNSTKRRLKILSELGRVSAGYGSALEFDLRRLPESVFSPLVRSGLFLGNLQLVHSQEYRSFPGHGVFVTDLLGAGDRTPLKTHFAKLAASSPVFAANAELLPQVKLLCTPGLLVFSPPSSLTLPIRSDQNRHFSLVFYGQNHRQPSCVHTLLVDTTWLKAAASFSLKSWRHDWNVFEQHESAADIRDAGLRPEQILAQNAPNKIIALDISSPAVALRGFVASLPESPPRSPPEGLGREIGRYLARTLELFTTWRLALAHIHKGLAGVPHFVPEQSGADAPARMPPAPILDSRLTPLVDVLWLHQALSTSGSTPQPTDPLLVTASALDYSEPADGDFILDVRSLRVTSHGLEKALFEPGIPLLTPWAQRAWLERFLPAFERNPLQDLRFIERRDLPRR